MCLCFGCGGVGDGGEEWVGTMIWRGEWCYICMSYESGLSV